jgi:hypothetical protein
MSDLEWEAPGPVASAFMKSTDFVRGIRGPLGSGKSVSCCIEIFRRAMQQAPNKDGIRRTKFAVVRNTEPELRTTTIATWLEWFPEQKWGRFNWSRPLTHHIRRADLDMEVIFLALDSPEDVKKLFSLEVTGAWVNEARFVEKLVVDTLTERVNRFPPMRDGGPSWAGVILDTNAMDPDHWWPLVSGEVALPDDIPEEEALMLQKPPNWQFFNQPPAVLEQKDGQGRTVGWEINPEAENLKALPKDYYRNQLSGKTRAHILRNLGNQLVVLQDGKAVFPSFRADIHVSRETLPVIARAPVIIGQDFGLTPAAVFLQRLHGRWLVQREMLAQRAGARQFGQAVTAFLAQHYPGSPVEYWCDPAGGQGAQTDDTTPIAILQALGLPANPAPTNDFQIRVETVESAFSRLHEGKPAILVDPSLRHLIKACAGGYHYAKLKIIGTTRYADAPLKNASSHVAEALGYALVGAGESAAILQSARSSKPVVASRGSPFERLQRRRG